MFMEKAIFLCNSNGYMAMINIPVWMSIPTYDDLREEYLKKYTLINMSHNGRGIFGSDFGSTSFVFLNRTPGNYIGVYCRLFIEKGQVDTVEEKEKMFLDGFNRFYFQQKECYSIPGMPLAYWESGKSIQIFKHKKIGELLYAKTGVTTGDNEIFLRLWYETSSSNWQKKWFPLNKGGEYRKWYGNNDYVINWENNGAAIKSFPGSTIRNEEFYFREGVTWSKITASKFSARYFPSTNMFDAVGLSCFTNETIPVEYVLAFLCSAITEKYVKILNQTVSYTVGTVNNLPFILNEDYKDHIAELSRQNITISKADWDSFETSWDFTRHPLVRGASTAAEAFRAWEKECEERFNQLKANEEELNRIFIDIYGLQDELTPEVEDRDVTVRKADLGRDVRSLLSYAVGCLFGRYSLDTEGLAYAGGEWDASRYSTFLPDADGILPITDEDYLDDDIVGLLCAWLKAVYGPDTLEESLDFIAGALGNRGATSREVIRNYFLKDFFADHCKMYQKRPIYWLFDSGKQNGFKALVYLHRCTPDTVGNVRIDYLHRMQRVYESEIERMQDMIDHSKNPREVAASAKRKEKLQKQLKECREYDGKISHLALSRIELDLDDGVKVNYRRIQTASDGKFYEVLADSRNIMGKK